MEEQKLLQAISQMMDEKLAIQKADMIQIMDGKLAVISREMDEKLAAQTQRIEELIKQNNVAIGDMFTKIVEDTRQEIETVKEITKNNTYAIVEMKARQKIAE